MLEALTDLAFLSPALLVGDASWLHDLDEVAVRLGPLPVRWYGLSYIAGFLAGWWLLTVMAKRGLLSFKASDVGDLMTWLIVGVFVGGRVGYAALYKPSLFVDFFGDLPFWGLLAVNKGGMASHGGMVGVILAAWLFARSRKVPLAHVLDGLALVAPIGLMFGRLANFVNGELLGKVVAKPGEAGPWWAVRYPKEMIERGLEHERLFDEAGYTRYVEFVSGSVRSNEFGQPHWFEIGIDRVIRRIQSGDADMQARALEFLSARHPSQLYQAFAEGVVVFCVVWMVARKRVRAGVIAGWFLIAYGVGRVVTELYRLPDAHLEVARVIGLSRGQWLSVGMVVVGVVMLLFALRGKGEMKSGGWSEKTQ
ncbi:MAG: prolipoprotein diacylglyceryl transferase [Planctomycetota bacterium]